MTLRISLGARDTVICLSAQFATLAVREPPESVFAALYEVAQSPGGPEDVPGGDRTDKLLMPDRSQPHRGYATASRAVGVATKLARFDPRGEIC